MFLKKYYFFLLLLLNSFACLPKKKINNPFHQRPTIIKEKLGATVINSKEDLPKCLEENDKQMYFVKSLKSFVVCEASSADYVNLDPEEYKGKEGEKGEVGKDGEKGEAGIKIVKTEDERNLLPKDSNSLVFVEDLDTIFRFDQNKDSWVSSIKKGKDGDKGEGGEKGIKVLSDIGARDSITGAKEGDLVWITNESEMFEYRSGAWESALKEQRGFEFVENESGRLALKNLKKDHLIYQDDEKSMYRYIKDTSGYEGQRTSYVKIQDQTTSAAVSSLEVAEKLLTKANSRSHSLIKLGDSPEGGLMHFWLENQSIKWEYLNSDLNILKLSADKDNGELDIDRFYIKQTDEAHQQYSAQFVEKRNGTEKYILLAYTSSFETTISTTRWFRGVTTTDYYALRFRFCKIAFNNPTYSNDCEDKDTHLESGDASTASDINSGNRVSEDRLDLFQLVSGKDRSVLLFNQRHITAVRTYNRALVRFFNNETEEFETVIDDNYNKNLFYVRGNDDTFKTPKIAANIVDNESRIHVYLDENFDSVQYRDLAFQNANRVGKELDDPTEKVKIKRKYMKRKEFSFLSSGVTNEVKIKDHADDTKKILELSDPPAQKDLDFGFNFDIDRASTSLEMDQGFINYNQNIKKTYFYASEGENAKIFKIEIK